MSYLNWKKLKKNLKNIGAAVGLSAVAYTTMGCSLTNADENAFEIVSITDDKLPDNFDEIVESSQVALNVSPTGNRYADIYKTIDKVKEILDFLRNYKNYQKYIKNVIINIGERI